MNRAKLLRLATSLASTRQLGHHSTGLTQVTRFSQLTAVTQPSPFSSTINHHVVSFKQFNLHRRSFSTSNSQDFDELISSNDWSEEIEAELEKLFPKLSNEFVVYCLMKLIKNPKKSLDFFKWVSVRKGFDPSYVPYTLLLRSLACKGFENDFRTIASKMREKGFYVEKSFYLSLLADLKRAKLDKLGEDWTKMFKTLCDGYDGDEVAKYVVNLVLEFDWSEEVKGKLEKKLTFPLLENFVVRVLREAWKQPLRAFKFFDWVGSSGGYEHDSVTYSTMLWVLATPESTDEFWEVFRRMKAEGFDVDFNSLVKILRYLPVSDAVTLFEMMMDGPYKPSLNESYLLLNIISRESKPDADLAYRVMNKCVAEGYTLSKKLYYGMHRIFSKVGKLDEAKKIVEEMRNAGYEPDNVTYSQEVVGLCVEKRLKEARDMLDHMEEEGCVPDIKTWRILIRGCCAADQVDEAHTYFSEMIGKNINPDAETLEVMLYGFVDKNKLLRAYKFLLEMVDNDDKFKVKPWQATYKLMIEKLAEVEKIDEALKVVSMMKNQGYPPFFNPIVQYISKSGTVDDAKKVLKAMSLSIAAYVWVIRSFIEKGREAEARDLIFSSRYCVRHHKEIRNMFSSNQRA